MSRKIAIAVVLLVTVGGTGAAFAQPGVVSVTGTVQNRGSITIQGTGFGVKSTAAPFRWDDFDSGLLGARLPDQSSGGWTTSATQAGKEPRYSNTHVRRTGTLSAYQNFTGGNYNSTISLQNAFDGQIYLSGWFYRTASGAPSRNFKWIQLRPGPLEVASWEFRQDCYPSSNSGHIYVSNCAGGTITGCDDEVGIPGYTAGNCNMYYGMSGDLFAGAWHRYEVWLTQGTQGQSNGNVRISLDGAPWMTMSGPFDPTGCHFRNMWLGFYFATDTGTPVPSMETWWDELYVDFTQARVELGNASTWAACTHREIQVPTAWSSTTISCAVNQGTFAAGQQVWAYVVDANGVANSQGYPVTFSGTFSDAPPTVSFTAPSTTGSYTTTSATISLAGVAADDLGLARVIWDNSNGGGGTATNVSGSWTAWSVPSVTLQPGLNVLTVFAIDSSGQSGSAALSVTYDLGPPGQPGQPVR